MKHLTNRQIPLYALSGFGPNLLMILVTAYMLDAVIPTGLVTNREFWSLTGAVIVSPVLFSVLFTLAKVFDGLVDVPLAALTDNLRGRWGRRRPAILMGFPLMLTAYVLMWFPPSNEEASVFNAIWVAAFALLFFSSYTLCFVAYYGSFSEIVPDEAARVRLSSWKSGFDTVGYSIAYALLPMFIGFGISIRTVVLCCLPLMGTMIIPLFLLKGREAEEETPPMPMRESLRLTLACKPFMQYLAVLAAFYFGLQMFLAGQNVIASGIMELNGWQITIMNTAAFAPVPLMLLLFNHLYKKKGLRFAFQTALLAFAAAMLTFSCARAGFFPNSWVLRLAIGVLGGAIGSYSIGAFFALPYIYPAQIAAKEAAETGKNHSAMYFAVQGLVNQIVSAVSVSLVYLNIKSLTVGGNETFGITLVPFLVAASCVLAFFLARRLPEGRKP